MHSNRPLSPHLQVYKLPLTGIISISHRITGVGLCFGLLLVVYILFMIASGAATYDHLQQAMQNWFIKIIYWGFLYALFFHLCHGIRHLIWDAGAGFDKQRLHRLALTELAAACSLTLLTALFI